MRLDLARVYGGGPAYWLDPDLDVETIELALDLIAHRAQEHTDSE